ncbi:MULTISPECIES: M28 family peptidase [Mycobacteriaceae]|uniref:M28 family peptidase n=1 Tax=Mycobacteriaceae TaxID=1762 RepID=UPI0008004E97|nr:MULTISPECIES: M28 family peptidase [Mycobacteriaceae]MCK0175637.1 M28 family peptidase [Mycolicibacterium sp. F2034L]OBB58669.1 peptidase M28 [Mycobacterium sp. 852013-51886_SCH5428379]
MRGLVAVTAAVLAAALAAACSSPAPPPPQPDPAALAARITADALYVHLDALQQIADAHGGRRSEGTGGYDASVDYVADTLRDKGFDVQTPEFERYGGTDGGNPRLTAAGRGHAVEKASLLIDTGSDGITALSLRPAKPAGCSRADYDGVDVTGAIAVVDDTGCSVVTKHDTALAEGAVGVLVALSGTEGSPPTLFTPGYYRGLTMPVGIIDPAANSALRRTTAPVNLRLDGRPTMVTSRNVIAQTRTGNTDDVVMAGAHLDSVGGGPGINDNGTGVAAVLETALQLGSSPQIANAVRFGFWGSEEIGLEGSRAYVRGLDDEQLADIALYLNFDMLGSPNAGYFTYDGDQSAASGPPIDVPQGSAGIERLLAGYLNLAGVRTADMPLADVTDYDPFRAAGIPFGGVTSGAAQRKSAVQARLWGGRPGVPFDPNHHTRRDDIVNVDRRALEIMAPSAAFAVATYARSIEGPNGVPPRDQRRRG